MASKFADESETECVCQCDNIILHNASRTQTVNLSPACNVETITVARKPKTRARVDDKQMHDSACQTQEDQK